MNKDAQGRWKVGMSNIKLKMRVKGLREDLGFVVRVPMALTRLREQREIA